MASTEVTGCTIPVLLSLDDDSGSGVLPPAISLNFFFGSAPSNDPAVINVESLIPVAASSGIHNFTTTNTQGGFDVIVVPVSNDITALTNQNVPIINILNSFTRVANAFTIGGVQHHLYWNGPTNAGTASKRMTLA